MILIAPARFGETRRTSVAHTPLLRLIGRMLLQMGALALVLFLGAMHVEASKASASVTVAPPGDITAPIDVLDVYLDVVNMNKCCDCHRTIC
jgi:hypothetical protein